LPEDRRAFLSVSLVLAIPTLFSIVTLAIVDCSATAAEEEGRFASKQLFIPSDGPVAF